VLPSGYLIRPCEGGGSMIHIVDHVDLDVSSIDIFLSKLGSLIRSPGLNTFGHAS
jgi:homeobox-leucine zipper protein